MIYKRIYLIKWTDIYGNESVVCAVNNPTKWLKDNNKQRINDGNEPEKLSQFDIKEIYYYEK